MLDTATKRRIDTARDILVGKVPDPKSQVEQITIALIYKFMDDMDAESEEIGGIRTFFANGFSHYGWAKLMHSGLGGHETLNLYAEAIARMPENPAVPLLFRTIFKNAYLPYRDPETLKNFLKIIDEFEYDHSERLGDAFEYLLSVLGSQGDAGQFRTPRHLIDFMVQLLDPKKDEKILDPACGTAGFLISSYKHILKANVDTPLTPDEKGALAHNIKGYDISPDMVRLSLVNLYLHGFNDPHIDEYDTLTSQEKWHEYADVILANPPFMSPKGGIKPHKRFSIQAKRSEVLFVDYMAEHLTPNGRAAIIVPEGIIFQSGTAYKQLRKMLVDTSLVAVVSLPAGVFQPYSGVKTSILILDKSLARFSRSIAFFKVENDGFGLGAQRRPVDNSDLPLVAEEIARYFQMLKQRQPIEDFEPAMGLIVPKEKIAENGEYNLSGERYLVSVANNKVFPMVSLGDVFKLSSGRGLTQSQINEGPYPVYGGNGKIGFHSEYFVENPVIMIGRVGAYCGAVHMTEPKAWVTDNGLYVTEYKQEINERFLSYALLQLDLNKFSKVGGQPSISQSTVYELHIPLPPLEIQKEIVAEIEGYQKVIDGARAVLDNYRPYIPIDPEWPMVELGEVCTLIGGGTPSKQDESYWSHGTVKWISSKHINEFGKVKGFELISPKAVIETSTKIAPKSSTIIISRVSVGKFAFADEDYAINQDLTALVSMDADKLLPLYLFMCAPNIAAIVNRSAEGIGVRGVTKGFLSDIKIPLPPLSTQQAIVFEIEAEQALVNANRELIERFEKKIQVAIARVWGEKESGDS
ncbi:MAG: N-6 DNA methylase [Chlorobiaceae bacterium]